MRNAMLVAAVLLAGCGGKSNTVISKDGTAVTTGADGSVTVQTNEATVNAGTAACSQKPDFVPVYAGAAIVTCVAGDQGTGKTGGMLIYTVSATPAAVLGWSKEQALSSGLTTRIETETMLSAGENNKRTLVVLAAADGSHTQATVNWGVEN